MRQLSENQNEAENLIQSKFIYNRQGDYIKVP
jgi:hypothetical protein